MWTAHHWQHWLARGEFPDHPWRTYLQRSALTLKGLTYAPTGALRRGGDDVAARDARRRAQLGLPLLVDPRLDVRAVGPLHARLRLGGQRLLLLHRRRGRAGDDELQIMYGVGGERELHEETLDHLAGYDGARPGAHRQRRVQPAPARRVGRGARLGLPPHAVARPARRAHVADPQAPGRGGASSTGRSPTAGSGRCAASPKHFTSSKVMCWVAARPRRAAGAAARGPRARRALAGGRPTRSTPTSARTASTSAASSPSTTTPTRSTRRCLLMPLVRFLPADDERVGATVLAIADELTVDGLVLRYRVEGDRRRSARRGGHVHDLLVLARVGAGRDRRGGARAPAVREAAVVREPARAVRRGDRLRAAAATSATSRRRSPTSRSSTR